jgi:acyl-CoA reductase-like NAD-dependent aldehyde dehydrogenase
LVPQEERIQAGEERWERREKKKAEEREGDGGGKHSPKSGKLFQPALASQPPNAMPLMLPCVD